MSNPQNSKGAQRTKASKMGLVHSLQHFSNTAEFSSRAPHSSRMTMDGGFGCTNELNMSNLVGAATFLALIGPQLDGGMMVSRGVHVAT